MRFSVEPFAGDSGFTQWHDAMKMCARLPEGIPPEFRRRMWLTLAEQHVRRQGIVWREAEKTCFNEWASPDDEGLGDQIIKDLHRTGCSLFCGAEAEGNQALLKRVLLGFARWNKAVGYCQGFNMLAAIILEVMDRQESDALKVMIYLIEGVLPESYFANNLRGLSVDMAVFRELMRIHLPDLSRHLETLQHEAADQATGACYEPPLTNVFTMQWFLTLFSNCLPRDVVMRVWDLTFLQGNEVLLRTALAIWGRLAPRILEVPSADEFYSVMGELTREMMVQGLMDANQLVQTLIGMAPFPFPGLATLRDKYTYNITPWTQSVSTVARKGLKIFLDEDEDEDKTDHDDVHQKMAIATAFGLAGFFRKGGDSKSSQNETLATIQENQDGGSSPSQGPSLSRPNLDISALKKQYSRLRERQRQAHVVLTASNIRRKSIDEVHKLQSFQKTNQLTMKHLLRGKKALTTRTKRVVTQGVIPPLMSKRKVERKSSDSAVTTKQNGSLEKSRNTFHRPLTASKSAKLPKSKTPTSELPPSFPLDKPPTPTEKPPKLCLPLETIHWKDMPKRARRASLPYGVKLMEAIPCPPLPNIKDNDDDECSSSSTELCDDDLAVLSEEDAFPALVHQRPSSTSPRLEKRDQELTDILVVPSFLEDAQMKTSLDKEVTQPAQETLKSEDIDLKEPLKDEVLMIPEVSLPQASEKVEPKDELPVPTVLPIPVITEPFIDKETFAFNPSSLSSPTKWKWSFSEIENPELIRPVSPIIRLRNFLSEETALMGGSVHPPSSPKIILNDDSTAIDATDNVQERSNIFAYLFEITDVTKLSNANSEEPSPIDEMKQGMRISLSSQDERIISTLISEKEEETPLVDSQTPSLDLQTPLVDSQTHLVDLQPPLVDPQTTLVDSQTPSVNLQTPLVGSEDAELKLSICSHDEGGMPNIENTENLPYTKAFNMPELIHYKETTEETTIKSNKKEANLYSLISAKDTKVPNSVPSDNINIAADSGKIYVSENDNVSRPLRNTETNKTVTVNSPDTNSLDNIESANLNTAVDSDKKNVSISNEDRNLQTLGDKETSVNAIIANATTSPVFSNVFIDSVTIDKGNKEGENDLNDVTSSVKIPYEASNIPHSLNSIPCDQPRKDIAESQPEELDISDLKNKIFIPSVTSGKEEINIDKKHRIENVIQPSFKDNLIMESFRESELERGISLPELKTEQFSVNLEIPGLKEPFPSVHKSKISIENNRKLIEEQREWPLENLVYKEPKLYSFVDPVNKELRVSPVESSVNKKPRKSSKEHLIDKESRVPILEDSEYRETKSPCGDSVEKESREYPKYSIENDLRKSPLQYSVGAELRKSPVEYLIDKESFTDELSLTNKKPVLTSYKPKTEGEIFSEMVQKDNMVNRDVSSLMKNENLPKEESKTKPTEKKSEELSFQTLTSYEIKKTSANSDEPLSFHLVPLILQQPRKPKSEPDEELNGQTSLLSNVSDKQILTKDIQSLPTDIENSDNKDIAELKHFCVTEYLKINKNESNASDEDDKKPKENSIEDESPVIVPQEDVATEVVRRKLWAGVKSLSLDAELLISTDKPKRCFLDFSESSLTILDESPVGENGDESIKKEISAKPAVGKGSPSRKKLTKRRKSEAALQLMKENTKIIDQILNQRYEEGEENVLLISDKEMNSDDSFFLLKRKSLSDQSISESFSTNTDGLKASDSWLQIRLENDTAKDALGLLTTKTENSKDSSSSELDMSDNSLSNSETLSEKYQISNVSSVPFITSKYSSFVTKNDTNSSSESEKILINDTSNPSSKIRLKDKTSLQDKLSSSPKVPFSKLSKLSPKINSKTSSKSILTETTVSYNICCSLSNASKNSSSCQTSPEESTSKLESLVLKFPSEKSLPPPPILNPFPTKPLNRPPKEAAVRLGLYSSSKPSGTDSSS